MGAHLTMVAATLTLLGALTAVVRAESPEPLAVLQEVCERTVPDASSSPGLSLAVQVHGAPPVTLQCGVADRESGRLIEADTPFHLASLTKQFVAFAILEAAHRGDLELDATIDQYLGAFNRADVPTVRQLMHHASGFYEHWAQWSLSDAPADTLDDIVQLAQAQEDGNFPAGLSFEYKNINYVLLARILEVVEGVSLPEVLETRIFDPVGMTRSGFLISQSGAIADRAEGYSGDPATAERVDYVVSSILGDGGLYASALDLLAWQGELVSPVLEDLRDARQAAYGAGEEPGAYYAAGLQVTDMPRGRLIHHGGANRGASTWIGYADDTALSVVVLSNSDQIDAQAVGLGVVEAMTGQSVSMRVAQPTARSIDGDLGLFGGSLQGQPLVLSVVSNGDDARVGVAGGIMRAYRLNATGLYERVDEPRLEIRLTANYGLEFFFEGRLFETMYQLPTVTQCDDAEGRWLADSLPGTEWVVARSDAGLTLSRNGAEPVGLETIQPGVLLAREAGLFIRCEVSGQFSVMRSGIRHIRFRRESASN